MLTIQFFVTNSIDGLQRLLDRVVMHCKRYGLTLNTKKTKYMIVCKRAIVNGEVRIEAKPTERVRKFKYLEQIPTEG